MADEIDHRDHVRRAAAGDGEHAAARGARAVARGHRAAGESDRGKVDELVDVLAEAGNVAGSPPPFAARGLIGTSAFGSSHQGYISCHVTGSGGRAAGSQKLRILTVGERRWIAAPAARATPPIMGFARAQPRSLFFTGSTRMRLPVAAKIALHSAGATGGTGGSPTPPQKPPLGTITVSTGGASAMRNIS